MAPAPLEPDEPDTSGQDSVPFGPQVPDASGEWLTDLSQAVALPHAGGPAGGAPEVKQGRRYGVVQEFDGDGIPVDPDPDWLSGRWDDSAEAAQYWAELEASLAAGLD